MAVINEIKQAFTEYENEKRRRRSVEAIVLLLVVVPVVVLGLLFAFGALG